MPRRASQKNAPNSKSIRGKYPLGSPVYRFIALSVPTDKPIEHIYKDFGHFGEVKFCVRLANSLQLTELGEYDPADECILASYQNTDMTAEKYNALVEVSELETLMKIKLSFSHQSSCITLKKYSSLCDQLIKQVHARKIFVFRLKKNIDEIKLNELMLCFGEIEAVRIVRNSNDYRSKGYGFVIYKDIRSRQASTACPGFQFEDKLIQWIPYRDDSTNPDKTVKRELQVEVEKSLGSSRLFLPIQQKIRYLDRQSTGVKVNSGSSQTRAELDGTEKQYFPQQSRRGGLPIPTHSVDHQYKFNRSRIISSAAVREYLARYSASGKPSEKPLIRIQKQL
jgi:RNA recognition motif-containing protein